MRVTVPLCVLAASLALSPAAFAADAYFKAKVEGTESLRGTVTSTDPDRCSGQATFSEVTSVKTDFYGRISAFVRKAGSARGHVDMFGARGEYPPQVPARVTVERQSTLGADNDPCPRQPDPDYPTPPRDCGTKTVRRHFVQLNEAHRGIRRFIGLAPELRALDFREDQDPYRNCPTANFVARKRAAVAPLSARRLRSSRPRRMVLRARLTQVSQRAPVYVDDEVDVELTRSVDYKITLVRVRPR